jgi:hypothetical protein
MNVERPRPKRGCLVCGKRMKKVTDRVHRRCARHFAVTAWGHFRQLSFLRADGQVNAVYRWGRSSIRLATAPRGLDAQQPKRFEQYELTPGKCAYCGRRVRNKTNKMHRLCERRVNNPPPPPPPPGLSPPKEWPASTWCEPCRSMDNSAFPAKSCRICGAVTGPLPAWMLPKPSHYATPKRTRIRGR